jgi:hypothetical protein
MNKPINLIEEKKIKDNQISEEKKERKWKNSIKNFH